MKNKIVQLLKAAGPLGFLFIFLSTAQAQLGTWISGTSGDYFDSANWQNGTLPGTSGTARIVGSSTVYFTVDDATSTGKVNLNDTATDSSTTSFIQTGGYFNIVGGGLQLGNTNSAPSTAAQYVISDGTLSTTSITFGTGTASSLIVNGGVVNIGSNGNGSDAIKFGSTTSTVNISSGVVTVTNSGEMGVTQGTMVMTGGTFNNNADTTRFTVGNNSTNVGTLNLSGAALFSVDNTVLEVARGSAMGVVNVSDNAVLNAAGVLLGTSGTGILTISDNAIVNTGTYGTTLSSPTGVSGEGIINLNGGTLSTASITMGYNNDAANTLNANGGTVQATVSSTDFFNTLYSTNNRVTVNILGGGLVFDTNSNNVGVKVFLNSGTNIDGGLTKKGLGTLTLNSGGNYNGTTTVQGGTLLITNTALTGQGAVSLSTGATLSINNLVQSFDALEILGNAILDFGTGATTISFTDSSLISWNGTLTLTDFIVGTSSMRFGIDDGGLTSIQLSDIILAGYGSAYLDSNGFLQFNAIPEPSTWGLLIAGILILGFCYRRQFNNMPLN